MPDFINPESGATVSYPDGHPFAESLERSASWTRTDVLAAEPEPDDEDDE